MRSFPEARLTTANATRPAIVRFIRIPCSVVYHYIRGRAWRATPRSSRGPSGALTSDRPPRRPGRWTRLVRLDRRVHVASPGENAAGQVRRAIPHSVEVIGHFRAAAPGAAHHDDVAVLRQIGEPCRHLVHRNVERPGKPSDAEFPRLPHVEHHRRIGGAEPGLELPRRNFRYAGHRSSLRT